MRRLVEGLLHVQLQLLQEPFRRRWVGGSQPDGELHVDGQCDQVLLDAIVQLVLDGTAVVLGREDEALSRGA